jgi:type IV pilus assembly protein PilQ
VAIEAMILSVALDDKNDVGVDFQFLRNKTHMRISGGSPLLNMGSLDVSSGGLKVGFLDSNLSSFVTALEQIGDTNVIATPRLMCLNKHRAEILIGQQLGYVNITQTQTSTTQSVQFLEVGTQLRLRPFIARDGMIRLEVHPELSTGAVKVQDGLTLPNKEVTQVTTNVMVRDGSTVVIGGLLRDELKTTTAQLPLLGSLPVVGPLFRHKKEQTTRSEILVLLTPRIVRPPQAYAEGEHVAREFHHRQMNYADQMMPLGKRYIGRKYFRRAQQAWAAGQQTEALRLINLSLHFDPMSRAALDLREDIATGTPVGDHTADFPGERGLLPGEMDLLPGPAFAPPAREGLPPAETVAPSVEQPPAFRPGLDSATPADELPPPPDEADSMSDPVVGPPLEPIGNAGE